MRRNNTYTDCVERWDGQSEKARSEKLGVKTDRHSQPAAPIYCRPSVQRKSLLRSQRSAASTLRDAAPPPCRGSLDGRSGEPVWRVAPDPVSGTGGLRAGRPERASPQAAFSMPLAGFKNALAGPIAAEPSRRDKLLAPLDRAVGPKRRHRCLSSSAPSQCACKKLNTGPPLLVRW
jgi:hypothetical protein